MNQPTGTHTTTALDEKNRQLDRDLSGVAKILTGTFVGIAGIGTAFGLSQDALLVSVNNDTLRYFWIAVLAFIAVALGIWSLFQGSNRRGNRHQAWMLGVGVVAYLMALVLAIWGVANTATGNGRPNLMDVTVTPNAMVHVSFTVHADGVKKKDTIIAEVDGFKGKQGEAPLENSPIYRGLLHPDDNGDVHQKVTFDFRRGDTTRLTIRARPDHESKDGTNCDASQASEKLGCITLLLPQ